MFAFSRVALFFRRLTAYLSAILIFAASGGGQKLRDLDPASLLLRGCHEHLLSVPSWSFYEPTAKILRTSALEKKASHTLYLAKNESEYCQLALQLRSRRINMRFTVSDFKNEAGDTLTPIVCEEHYIKTTGSTVDGVRPDALIPFDQEKAFDMEAATNYVFFLGVKTAPDTAPGDYVAELTLTNPYAPDSKFENLKLTLTAHVWDFALPDAPAMETAMGLSKGEIAREHGVAADSEKADQLYKDYYEFLLQHKISAYGLPVDILSDEAERYMNDPRCTTFCIPYASDETIRAYYDKLSENPEWMRKGYFYPIDEPSDEEAYARYNAIAERLSSLFPGYNMVTPFYTNEIEIGGEKTYGIDLQSGKSSILCPESVIFDNDGFPERAAARQALGDRVWWYVCCGPAPTTDYCNLFVQQDGIKHRLLFWQQKQQNVTGFLYWNTVYWCDAPGGPWASAWTTPWTGPDTFGDGSLLYPGRAVGVDGPVSSLRLEAVTNGIEDYEYLCMAEKLLGADFVNGVIASVSKDLTHYTLSDAQFAVVRTALGAAIEHAANA